MALLSLKIFIQTKAHDEQRYDTCGDWQFNEKDGSLTITVSQMHNWKQELCVALHELIEATLCRSRGITDDEVTQFDKLFNGPDEPGDATDAPYRKEHFFATSIERLFAAELGVDWKEYEEALDSL